MPRDSPLSDEAIVRHVLAGETSLFEVLMRRHNRKVFRAARSLVRSDDAAEDVMQAAYLAAFAKLSSFEGKAAVSTWLVRIAIHEALARLRRDRRWVDPPSEEEPMDDRPEGAPERRASDGELRGMLEEAIDALPPPYRTIFVLRSVEELEVAEIAEALEVAPETVRTRHHRARLLLQEALLARVASSSRDAFDFHLSRCDRVVAGVLTKLGGMR